MSKTMQRGVTELPEDWSDPHWKIDQEMVDILTDQDLDFDFVRVDLTRLPDDFPDQVRDVPVLPGVIERYMTALSQAVRLPCGTIDMALDRVDLNHRLKAARQLGLPDIVLLRIKKVLSTDERNLLAVKRNMRHGLPPTQAEINETVLNAVLNLGWSLEAAAAEYQVDQSTLRRAIADHNTLQRAVALGVGAEYASLRKTPRYQLSSTNFHDGPFKAMIRLLADHPRLSAGRQVELITRVANQSSDSKQMAEIKLIRSELKPPPIGGTPVSDEGATAGAGAGASTGRNGHTLSFDEAVDRIYHSLSILFGDTTITKALAKGNGDKGNAVKEIQHGYEALAGIIG